MNAVGIDVSKGKSTVTIRRPSDIILMPPHDIIDEANYSSNSVLNDLKILFNFEMDSKDRAVILLVNLPQLNSTLRLGVHEPLR